MHTLRYGARGLSVVYAGKEEAWARTDVPSLTSFMTLSGSVPMALRYHGAFVSCVAHSLNALKKAGVITGKEKGALQRCAAQADMP